MIIINTTEFSHYTEASFLEFLECQKEFYFQVRFAKSVVATRDDPMTVFWEYHLAAFIGHRLSLVSHKFAYYVPSVYKRDPYKFDIVVTQLQPFAYILFDFILVFHKYAEVETVAAFETEVSGFFTKIYAENVELNTWGLLSLANQFLCNNFPR